MQLSLTSILAAALVLSACAGGATPSSPSVTVTQAGAFERSLKQPAIVAFDTQTGRLETWPLQGGKHVGRRFISGPLGFTDVRGMVGNGDVVSMTNYSPAEIVNYNIDTRTVTTLPDPYGGPTDVAIDTQGTLYALDVNGVAVYKAGSNQPYRLTCDAMVRSHWLAVDNEGDVLVIGELRGYGLSYGVIEYAAGSSTCTSVPVRSEGAPYVGGIGIDPTTDDLIVVDKVGCAGGHEGSMIIYRRPYGTKTVRRGNLRGNCPGPFRLDATSTHILFPDGSPELGDSARRRQICYKECVTQRSYPGLREVAIRKGGYVGGVTTIPNRLPN